MSDTMPWEKTIRRASGLVEHICKCGVGHPAIGSVQWLKLHGDNHAGVHGCCGCCTTTEWRLADAVDGLRITNELLQFYVDKYVALQTKVTNDKTHSVGRPVHVRKRRRTGKAR